MRTVDWRTIYAKHAEPGQLRRVLTALACSMGGAGGQDTNCSPNMDQIARLAGMKKDDASRWIGIAEKGGTYVTRHGKEIVIEGGWINVGRKVGMANRYYATVPSSLKAELEALEEQRLGPGATKFKRERTFRKTKAVAALEAAAKDEGWESLEAYRKFYGHDPELPELTAG